MNPSARDARELRVVIVGAGFGGLGLGVMLRQAGLERFTILERAADVGGVWRDNHYPGAACDIPAVLYSYSFEADYPWSTGYPPQSEILGYIRHVVSKYGLAPHIRFGQEVVEASWQEHTATWSVRTAAGECIECDVFVPAVGIFNKPIVPRLAGADSFQGAAFHSTDWRHDIDYRDQRVAVIGAGASAIQIVPELVRQGAQVQLYQRTAPYVMPKSIIELRQPRSERQRIFDDFESRSGRRKDLDATAIAQADFARYLRGQVPEDGLREKLTPNYTLGCKRPLFSNDWYAALRQPSVEVITDAIERVRPRGICTRDGQERGVDVIVYATGFDPANYLPGLTVRGRNGALLSAAWKDGAEAYLGITVTGFPNLFMLFGPNTNVPGSVLYMLECQARYVCQALQTLATSGHRAIDVMPSVMRAWCDAVQEETASTTQSRAHCRSYYHNEAGRVVTNYPGNQRRYQQETAVLRESDYLLS